MGSRSNTNTERERMALDAMKSLGFSKKEATPVLRSLLKLFANNWEPIEDECYRALADAILDSRDLKETGPVDDGEQEQEHEPRSRTHTTTRLAPEDDPLQPSTSLVGRGGSCDSDNENDTPRIKRPRTNSTNFTTNHRGNSLDPHSPPSTAEAQDATRAIVHKRPRQMMGDDFQHAVFLREPKPEPDMDAAQGTAAASDCQNAQVGLIAHPLNASSSGVGVPLAFLPPDQNPSQISGCNLPAATRSSPADHHQSSTPPPPNPMDDPLPLSASLPAASSYSQNHLDTTDEGIAACAPGPSFADWARVTGPRVSSSPVPVPEVQVRALVSMAGGLYPLARAEALRGLAAVLEKVDAGGGVVKCCYSCTVELLRDEDEGVRLASVRLISLCAEKFAAREELDGNGDADQMDLIFLQLSSMARDMCTKVRIEAFNALGKLQRVSEGVLLQSLSKKVIRADTGSGSISKGKKLPPKLIFPCAAGIFAHGIEDEFYQVRTAACKSLGALAKFSIHYAQKALDLLMDMMNDDTEAVRLQTLQTLFHMATYGYLSVQEKHMHMFLGLLIDANAIIRNAAHKILGLVNLPKLQMFKSAVDGLITSLEKNPEEQDIYGVLFSIGKNHGSFSATIAKHLAKEISMVSDGELILDKPRIKALLIVSISTSFSDGKHNKLDIPPVIFSHAIPLLGKISCALGEQIKQDSLLSYLCQQSGMPFWEKRLVFAEAGKSEGSSVETVGETHAQTERTGKETNCLDEVLIMRSIRLILETVEGAWTVRMSCSTREIQTILRTCKEEIKILSANSSGSTGAFLSFLCEYLDAIQFIVEIWQLIQLKNSYAFSPTSLDILLEKLDTSVRRMKCCYSGLNRELEIQVLELALLANLFRLSKIGICSQLVLDKLHWIISCLEDLCADGSCELSVFSKEVKKAFDAKFIDDTPVVNICTLLEIFHLKPTTDFGMLNAISAVLQVWDNDSENPLSYICGLPVGVSFYISLCNISSHHRLWLRMIAGESIQHTFLELSCFGGNDEVKSCSTVVPFYATPMVCSFVLRVCLVMECPYGSTSTRQEGHGGPRDCEVQLCDDLEVYFVSTEQR